MPDEPSARESRRPRRRSLVVVVAALVVALVACGGSQVQTYGTPRAPVTRISNHDYQSLLDRYVTDGGRVDYGRWKDSADDVRALDDYLATLTTATPDSRPDLFTSQTDELSFWINLYNAIVLREIIRRWPLDSVTDAKVNAGASRSGKGFFYDLVFVVGGAKTNLHDLENKILRARFKDARIHFAISCGSSSCALLRKEAFDPTKLESQLESSAAQFVNDGKNVIVDDARKQVVLSKLFEWYEADFVAFTRRGANVKDAGVVDFALLYATEPLAARLKAAKARSYQVAFLDYDWNVNQQSASATAALPVAPLVTEGVGKPVPDVAFELADGSGSWKPSSARGKVVVLDFWATFCVPCRQSFPWLQELQENHKDALVVVGVSEDDDPKAVLPAFLAQTGARFLIAVDPQQRAGSSLFNVTAMPTELIIDRKGIVRHRHEGLRQRELQEIVKQVEDLLREK